LTKSGIGTPPTNGTPLVTIITPTLNQGAFIDQTLRSVRTQTYRPIEHVVVDGGSSDNTLAVLRRHADEGSIRFTSGPDQGMYDAINKGLAEARGDVIGYLNSDDVYFPWTIAVVLQAFARWPDVDVVFGDGLTVDESRHSQRLSLVPPFEVTSLALVGSLVQPGVFIRRRVFDSHGGFDPSLRFVGDLEYWLRIGATTKVRRIDEVLAVERVHLGALSTAQATRMALEEHAMRSRFTGTSPILGLARLLARSRAAVWRRRLLIRFISAAHSRSTRDAGWSMFLRHGDVRIDAVRAAKAMIPRLGGRYAWGAIESRRNWFAEGGGNN
jgi:glycosyltransferase involved in cell wall biosynthesis